MRTKTNLYASKPRTRRAKKRKRSCKQTICKFFPNAKLGDVTHNPWEAAEPLPPAILHAVASEQTTSTTHHEERGNEEELVGGVGGVEEFKEEDEDDWANHDQPQDELDEAEWEDDTPQQGTVAWEDPNKKKPGTGDSLHPPLAVLHDMPMVCQRVVEFKNELHYASTFTHRAQSSAEARELSDIVILAMDCLVPAWVTYDLLRDCERKHQLDVLQDVLVEVWYNAGDSVLPSDHTFRFALHESVRFYAAALQSERNDPDFMVVCTALCTRALDQIPIRQRFIDNFESLEKFEAIVPELIEKLANDYFAPFDDRCSLFCQVMSHHMESTQFLKVWLGGTSTREWWFSESTMQTMIDSFLRWFVPDGGFWPCISDAPRAVRERLASKAWECEREAASGLDQVLISELVRLVEDYWGLPASLAAYGSSLP